MARPIFIVDVEATCWENRGHYTVDQTEIIEIGCVLATPDGKVLDEFCTFVRPVMDPILSDFCTQLTSINQIDVDEAPIFREAMNLFDAWIAGRLGVWGSWGNYDYRIFSSMEQRFLSDATFLSMQHVNLKKAWKKTTGHPRTGLRSALAFHNLEFLGTHHRGIDDARNMARLLKYIDYQKIRAGVGALQWDNR